MIPTDKEVSEWAIRTHSDYHSAHPKTFGEVGEKKIPEFYQYFKEVSFRRGFMHGIAHSLTVIDHLVKQGFYDLDAIGNIIEHWNHSTLYPWRHQTSSDVASGKKRGEHPMEGHPQFRHEPWEVINDRIVAARGGRCCLCDSDDEVRAYYVTPPSEGGLPHDDNLQPLCFGCHASKNES